MDARATHNSNQAKIAINYLRHALSLSDNASLKALRDHALRVLDEARCSDLYESIQAKLGRVEIQPLEYAYYALVTDDVNTVDPNILAGILDYTTLPYNLKRNLTVLISALRFSQATTEKERTRYHQDFINQLGIDVPYENAVRPVFLNLAGIRLKGVDSNVRRTIQGYMPSLSFSDLRGAQFTDCNLYSMKMHTCDVSGAVFTNVSNGKDHSIADFNLAYCIARGARFDGVKVSNNAWNNSDFTDAQFVNSSLGEGCFRETNFTNALFSNTDLIFSGSYDTYQANFTNCDFTTARLHHVNYEQNNFSNVHIIKPENTADIKGEISRVTAEFIKDLSGSAPYVKGKLAAFQKIMKTDVERYINSLILNDDEKENLLREVMQHDLFHYEYMEAVKALVAEPFPRQLNPLVIFGDYDDERFTSDLKDESLKVYKTLYADGVGYLKRFADAIANADGLEQYNEDLKEQFLVDIQYFKDNKNLSWMPPEISRKDNNDILTEVLDINDKIDKQHDKPVIMDKNIREALLLSIACYGNHCEKELMKDKTLNCDEIRHQLGHWHPFLSLGYYAESNCMAPYFFKENNGAFHSAQDLINEFTNPARLAPTQIVNAPSVTAIAGTMFGKPAGEGVAADEKQAGTLRMSR